MDRSNGKSEEEKAAGRREKKKKRSGAYAPLPRIAHIESSSDKEAVGQPAQHGRPLNFRLKEGNDGADPVAEGLPDLLHVLILHLHPVADELRGIGFDGLLLDQAIDHHATNRNPEVMEPIDESGNDRDRQAFRQRNEEECRNSRLISLLHIT